MGNGLQLEPSRETGAGPSRQVPSGTSSLKEPFDMSPRNGFVCKLSCPRCNACYVRATSRHLQVRFNEHVSRKPSAVSMHLEICGARREEMNMEVLGSTPRGEWHLFTLDTLMDKTVETIN